MGNTNENIIELKHINRIFEDGFKAVEDFNLEVKRGEFVTFLGPSGCGKTTTLRMIAGFDMPTSGDILLNGNLPYCHFDHESIPYLDDMKSYYIGFEAARNTAENQCL